MFVVMAIESEDIGRTLLKELARGQMAQKEAASLMHLPESQLTRILQGSADIGLKRILELPWRVFAPFWRAVSDLKAADVLEECSRDGLVMAKASLRTHGKEGAA